MTDAKKEPLLPPLDRLQEDIAQLQRICWHLCEITEANFGIKLMDNSTSCADSLRVKAKMGPALVNVTVD